jgi:hypothetical protein
MAQQREPYETAPEGIVLPETWGRDDVHSARGNFLAVLRTPSDSAFSAYVPVLSGYFAEFGESNGSAGIVRGTFYYDFSERAHRSILNHVHGFSICGAPMGAINARAASVTYLGNEWLPQWEALDIELGGDFQSRALEGTPAPVGAHFVRLNDLQLRFPSQAGNRRVEGVVALACLGVAEGRLRCGVSSEHPDRWRFGMTAREYYDRDARISPTLSDGSPSEGMCVPMVARFDVR